MQIKRTGPSLKQVKRCVPTVQLVSLSMTETNEPNSNIWLANVHGNQLDLPQTVSDFSVWCALDHVSEDVAPTVVASSFCRI